MKRIIAVFVCFVACAVAFCGCEKKMKNSLYSGEVNQSDTTQSSGTEEKPATLNTPAPEQKNETVQLKAGETLEKENFTIKVNDPEDGKKYSIEVKINGKTNKIGEGEFLNGYYIEKDGEYGIVAGYANMESECVETFIISDNKVESVTKKWGELLSLDGDIISIYSSTDVIGTWIAKREYTLSEGFALKDENDGMFIIIADTELRELTALQDIPAVNDETGEEFAILKDIKVILAYTDGKTFAVFQNVENIELFYRVEVEKDGYGGFVIGAEKLPEAECFDNIQYSG